MSEQAGDINSYTKEKKTTLDYLFLVGGWMVSSFSLVTVGLISYWAINIPEKSVNDLPIISALKEDIRVEPDDPGGKSFDEENLSIYKNLESDLEIPEKNEITLNDPDQTLVNLQKKLKVNENTKSEQENLTLAIEDALREVVNGNEKKNDELEAKNQNEVVKLYLGSFDTMSQAVDFKRFIKKRNNSLLNNNNLKIFKKLEGEKKVFRVELTDISSEEEGKKLCSILSSRQFSCLLFNEIGSK